MALDLEAIKLKIAELEQALEKSLPGYAGLLNTIHKEFGQQPELLYKLDDEQIAIVINGLQQFHKVEIVDQKAKKAVSKKVGATLSADDV